MGAVGVNVPSDGGVVGRAVVGPTEGVGEEVSPDKDVEGGGVVGPKVGGVKIL